MRPAANPWARMSAQRSHHITVSAASTRRSVSDHERDGHPGGERERRLRGGQPDRDPGQRDAPGGQIGDDAVQLAVGPGAQRRVQPVLELVGLQPSLARGLAQPLGDGLAVGVGGSE